MEYADCNVSGIRIAYIGGGSRGWAWGFMSDLVAAGDISGEVLLYDIDYEAACANEIIGNRMNDASGALSHWTYKAVRTIGEALAKADFVVISILPGTFDEMESDVHEPERFGIYQSVGDSSGPGGIVRAMRTVPMFEEIAENIEKYSPDAWVINYTNPMTLCTRTLYRVFPEIKAFGCCHEVFGTQKLLKAMLEENGYAVGDRSEIKVNVVGVNHFTWLTDARFHDIDLFPMYRSFVDRYRISGYHQTDNNWMNNSFISGEKVKMDLFHRFGYIAAAGDRHLAEFCPGNWYLESPDRVRDMHFSLTPVAWRKKDLEHRLARSRRLVSGEEKVSIKETGEEGVSQIRALLGLQDLVTNVNIPNRGQIPNLPLGAVVETNAVFRSGSLEPVFAGPIPNGIHALISRISIEQEAVSEAIANRNMDAIFEAFSNDPLVTCSLGNARKLFDSMCRNTSRYLGMFELNRID